MTKHSTLASILISIVFLVLAILGFNSDSFLGRDTIFISNTAYDLLHLGTAIWFVIVSLMDEKSSVLFIQTFGIAYLLVSFIGFMEISPQGNEKMYIQTNFQNYIHFSLGLLISSGGTILNKILLNETKN